MNSGIDEIDIAPVQRIGFQAHEDRSADGIDVDHLHAALAQHERLNSQTELVIFLRPIIVTDGSWQDDELRRFQRLLPARTTIAP